MPMCNLLEYSENYSETSASLWNYYRDELTVETNDNNGSNKNVINSKSFKYKTSITGSIYNVPKIILGDDSNPLNNPNYDRNKKGTKEVEIAVPLKHLGNLRNNLNISLINCELSLNLSWSETCVITSTEKRILVAGQPNRGDSPESAAFKIKDCKNYVPVITLSAENDNKLLKQLKTGFEKTMKWNKYRSEKSSQTKNNNLNYLIDIPVKNKEESYEAIIEMSKNNDYTTGNLLDYEYSKDHYKLIAIDLSKQTELENPDLKQQINFIGRLEENNATMFFLIEKKEETIFDFSQNSVVVV